MEQAKKPLRIDIVSDVVCPWCAIGYSQLAKALKQTNTPHEIHWHPFELNPNTPHGGRNYREHIMEKYGTTAEDVKESRARMTAAGAEAGFNFQFTDDFRTYNTFNAHQLLHWADQQGRMHDLKQALFVAHFVDNKNVADSTVLADVAADIGLDRNEALAVIADQRFANVIREAVQHSKQQGVQSVPSVIFNGRHLVSGAQGVENYKNILKQLADMPE
ncbi:2-hydroxychromene-2-carboxylate isomerase/DsbA-like thioredoxin domain [Psychrobacter sp. JCM 18901]|uniref:DsbA family oxidoreductase n=1 Tax=Psychrobacter sp. JCM 18901 TaxID=1298609 RepID=UPI00043639AA|nr:DsbA family oxidoreductase [Psychrobacter sp. JCM 18901]GAF56553.1 2-hydroxychromene-2-carboxylate isomerase/DsbA-like thioredoxin domain [Psychrobacter sp. JCM 18901]